MRAITLWQPYAALIAVGAKRYETRSWSTRWRGDLVIHAAAKRDAEIVEALRIERPMIARLGLTLPPLVYGAALCVVELTDCVPAELLPDEDRRFGWFGAGRFAWELRVKEVFDPPIPAKGAQGFWEFQLNRGA